MLVFDWGEIGPLFVFCAVHGLEQVPLRLLRRQPRGRGDHDGAGPRASSTSGAVPKTALTDRMGCLKGDTVAGLVVPTPAYVRFATHYGFRPDFC